MLVPVSVYPIVSVAAIVLVFPAINSILIAHNGTIEGRLLPLPWSIFFQDIVRRHCWKTLLEDINVSFGVPRIRIRCFFAALHKKLYGSSCARCVPHRLHSGSVS